MNEADISSSIAKHKTHTLLQRLVCVATLLALIVVALGAYTRLKDAGLGCPDWPGCYGFLTVPEHVDDIAIAEARYPHAPVEPHK
ncbi:MAG: COX15/CtaA family protein, partial [Pseudomonadales bacterium]|nr:COX15/CtaA family protein [Pseudomonadales bacterium]